MISLSIMPISQGSQSWHWLVLRFILAPGKYTKLNKRDKTTHPKTFTRRWKISEAQPQLKILQAQPWYYGTPGNLQPRVAQSLRHLNYPNTKHSFLPLVQRHSSCHPSEFSVIDPHLKIFAISATSSWYPKWSRHLPYPDFPIITVNMRQHWLKP